MRTRSRLRTPLVLLAVSALGAAGVLAVEGGPPAEAAPPAYTVSTLHFRATVGPRHTVCDVVGDLYLPRGASAKKPVPAILTTNGFGGSKDDQADIGRSFAGRGYAVLSYSGLGFGGSGCKITLDDPDWDGRAASQLVSYLGGARGIAFTDAAHTKPAPVLTAVKRDPRDHAGRRQAHDPRVGMIGGSYGGAVQFAAASIDPRIDTIVPVITWNDLSYSLAPNNTSQTTGVHATTPGSTKLVWGVGFSALGAAQGLEHVGEDPRRVLGCPNFATFVCPALLTGATAGFLGPRAVDKLRHASVTSYVKRVKVPVLLAQGEKDTLFNLNEAVATYQALRRQGTPVSMIWHSWGHSSAAAAPGEYDITAKPGTHYETDRVVAWFERYLKGRNVSTGPAFAYFRPWVAYRGSAAPAYAAANSFPVGRRTTWRLSGRGDLTTGASVAPGSQLIVTPVAGLSTSLASADIVADLFAGTLPLPEQSLPGTYAVWSAPAQRKPLDVAGIPQARLRVETVGSALTRGLGLDGGRGGLGISVGTGGSGGAGVSVGVDVSVSGNGRRAGVGDLVLFLSVVDIAPDGTRSMIDQTIAPVRVPDVTKAFTVNLPAIVHRFEPGHRVGLVVAGSSVNYRGNLVPRIVTISAGKDQTLSLPVVG